MVAAIKRLEAAKVDTGPVCCAERDLFKAMQSLGTVMITHTSAFGKELATVDEACAKASDKKTIVEIPHDQIKKAKKVPDKSGKALIKAEAAHKKALEQLNAAMGKQTGHLHCMLKEAEGDEAKQIKGLIAATEASKAKVIAQASTVLVNGQSYRDHLATERKAAEKKLKAAEKQQEKLKKKMAKGKGSKK